MSNDNRPDDIVELEKLAEEHGWSPEETDAFWRWFKVERKRRFIERMQFVNKCRHDVSK